MFTFTDYGSSMTFEPFASRSPLRPPPGPAVRRAAALRRRARVAEAAAAARTEALATLSHEMREPLNGIVGMARLLADTRLDSEQRAYAQAVVESAETLVTLINDLLDVARIDATGVGLTTADFSLPHLLESLRRMLEPRAKAKGLAFVLHGAADLPEHLVGDPGRLRQILVNLCCNALKFTERGRIGLAVSAAEDPLGGVALRFRVTDTGPGMAPGTYERLTAPFSQADPSILRLYGGSGLGLMITRRVLEAMGGSLGCESALGHGTSFTAAVTLQTPGPDAAGRPRAPSLLVGRSLLIVDGQERTARTVRDVATLWGMDVRLATTGRDALGLLAEAAARQRPFELVVIDAGLEDLAPAELARRVQADPGQALARLVLLARAGFRGDAARARAEGFAAYLMKPVEADLLRACLQRLMDGRPSAEILTAHGLVEARRRLNVLVVDDNPVNCRLAAIMLERAGHAVTVAGGGAEALARLEEAAFDIVLMDVQMPEMDGMETTRRIRALEAPRAGVPIVAVTANALPKDEQRCAEAGMDGYVTKPIDGASLVATVEALATTAANSLPRGRPTPPARPGTSPPKPTPRSSGHRSRGRGGQ